MGCELLLQPEAFPTSSVLTGFPSHVVAVLRAFQVPLLLEVFRTCIRSTWSLAFLRSLLHKESESPPKGK